MRRIVFINTITSWGGGEKWFFENALRASKDFYVFFVTRKKSELSYKLQTKKEIKLVFFNISNISFLNLIFQLKIWFFLKRNNIDLIIVNSSKELKSIIFPAKILNIKIIYRRGSDIPIKKNFFNKILYEKLVDLIIANSYSTKKTIEKNIKPKQIIVLYNGVKDEFLNIPQKNKNNLFVVGNLGRLSYQKNQIFFLKIAKKMSSYKDITFLLGGAGKEYNNLKKFIKNNNLTNVKMLGFINPKKFFSMIDLFVLTSRWEGFGYVVVEAMLSSKPVISINVSNLSELVENNKTGFLIENYNIDKFVEKILFFYYNKDEIKKFGEYGREIALKKFNFEKQYQKLKQIFLEI